MDIIIEQSPSARQTPYDLENFPFGEVFTDHMLVAEYCDGQWQRVSIKPYQPLLMPPSASALHYGQIIFEGLKAYRHEDGQIHIFRPYENLKRLCTSAVRMQMPQVPEYIFIEGMRRLIELDQHWVPKRKDQSLYIRPMLFAVDESIALRPGHRYQFIILLSPAAPYYSEPIRIYLEERYIRAAPGGVGFAKAGGNYGGVMYPTEEAKKKGYDQVLWMDAFEKTYLQEFGMMNGFVVIGDRVITPNLDDGTILPGVTRDSVIFLFRKLGITVEERPVSIQEMIDAYAAGDLKEVFGTGTATAVIKVKEIYSRQLTMSFQTEHFRLADAVKQELMNIREGRTADTEGWLLKV